MNRASDLTVRCRCLLLLAAALLLPSCSVSHSVPLAYTKGAVVETLSAAVSLSYRAGDRGISGSGYLVYSRPDRLRLMVISPFGTTLMEVYVNGDRIVIVDPGKEIAFAGRLAELPERGETASWRKVRWVMEMAPMDESFREGTMERVNSQGGKELLTLVNGLITAKALQSGDEVRYGDYAVFNGVPLAMEIIMSNAAGDRFRLKFDEPEINGILAPDLFTPRLDGVTVYPLSSLKER